MFYIDAETSDYSWRAASKFLLSQLLHMEYEVSLFQSTGECLHFSVLNLVLIQTVPGAHPAPYKMVTGFLQKGKSTTVIPS